MRQSLTLVAALAATALLALPTPAQETVYLELDFMAVPPGAEAAYLALEQEVWRPIHAERQRQGQLLNWMLYEVQFAPPGIGYDYVTVNVHQDLASAEAGGLDAIIAAAHPDRDAEAVLAGTLAAREVVHRELWALVSSVAPDGQEQPLGRHLAVNFMAVPEAGRAEYFEVEHDVWVPIHQVRANDGSMGGWALYSLVLPRGEAMDYQFGTVDFFDDLDSAAAGITGVQIGRAHTGVPQADIDAMMTRTDAARSIHKTELWSLVASLDGPDS